MTYEKLVQQYYVGFYGRAADKEGLDFWTAKVEEANGDFSVIQNAFANSAEYENFVLRDVNGEQRSYEELVNFIYNNLFGRDAEDEGLQYYVEGLEEGTFTLVSIVQNIIDGADSGSADQTVFQNRLQVAQHFTDGVYNNFRTYQAEDILQARTLLAMVDESGNSVSSAVGAANTWITHQPLRPIDPPTADTTFTLVRLEPSMVTETETKLMWGRDEQILSACSLLSYLEDLVDNDLFDMDIIGLDRHGVLGPDDAAIFTETIEHRGKFKIEIVDEVIGENTQNEQKYNDDGTLIEESTSSTAVVARLVEEMEDGTTITTTFTTTKYYLDFVQRLLWGEKIYEYDEVPVLDQNGNQVVDGDGNPVFETVVVGESYQGGLLFDSEGNIRIWEWSNEHQVVTYYANMLTPDMSLGVFESGYTTDADDLIVAGRPEFLHGAYIDGGGGFNTLEVDMKGPFAQPLQLLNIQKVSVQNLPNIYDDFWGDRYLDVDGSGDYWRIDQNLPDQLPDDFDGQYEGGYGRQTEHFPYPFPNYLDGTANSALDLSRAVHLVELVVTEGTDVDTHGQWNPGSLTVFGIRNGVTSHLDGGFTQDVFLHYGEAVGNGVNLRLSNVNMENNAELWIAQNSDTLNIESTGGGNWLEEGYLGGRLSVLNITGDAHLYIEGDLDDSFHDQNPITIDASANTAWVNLNLTGSEQVTFYGTDGNDRFRVETTSATGNQNDESVNIIGGGGNNYYEVETYTATITNGDGNNNYEVDAYFTDIAAGHGSNHFEIESVVTHITAGDGNNRIDIAPNGPFSTARPNRVNDADGEVNLTVGDGSNIINVCVGTDFLPPHTINITAGDGGNTISARGDLVTIQTGAGDDVINVFSTELIEISTGAGNDAITISGGNDDYVPNDDGAIIKIDTGSGNNTLSLGDTTDVFPFPNLDYSITAMMGSYITGENITLFVNTVADLRAAELEGITTVVLDDEAFTRGQSQKANDIIDESTGRPTEDVSRAVLTLTDKQFAAIGAENFKVDGSVFHTHAYVQIIVTESTSLTDLGVDKLSRNIDLLLEIQDGVTLTMTAEQLHKHVAPEGITLADDGNTDYKAGDVVITGGGFNFDPFNTNDTVKTIIGGNVYYGGSLSPDDFMVGSNFFNVEVDSVIDGWNRPADALAEITITLDTSADDFDGTQGAFSTWYPNFTIKGENDVSFTGPIALGMLRGQPEYPFTIDFSELEGAIDGLTVLNFQNAWEVIGNGKDGTRIDVHVAGDVGVYDQDPQGRDIIGNGLLSSGVQTYVVVDIEANQDPATGFDIWPTFYVCSNTKDLEVLGLQANAGKLIRFMDVDRTVTFLMEGEGQAYNVKPSENWDVSGIGVIEAFFAGSWDGPAVVDINNQGYALPDDIPIQVDGIWMHNVRSVTINVDEGNAVLLNVHGWMLETVTLTSASDYDVTLYIYESDWEAINADGVGGTATLLVPTAWEMDLDIDLSETELSGIGAILVEEGYYSGNTLTLTADQIQDIGVDNITGEDDTTLNIVDLGAQAIDLSSIDVGNIGTVSIVDYDGTVVLDDSVNLGRPDALVIQAGESDTTLKMTEEQFQQLKSLGVMADVTVDAKADPVTGEYYKGVLFINDLRDDLGDPDGGTLDLSGVKVNKLVIELDNFNAAEGTSITNLGIGLPPGDRPEARLEIIGDNDITNLDGPNLFAPALLEVHFAQTGKLTLTSKQLSDLTKLDETVFSKADGADATISIVEFDGEVIYANLTTIYKKGIVFEGPGVWAWESTEAVDGVDIDVLNIFSDGQNANAVGEIEAEYLDPASFDKILIDGDQDLTILETFSGALLNDNFTFDFSALGENLLGWAEAGYVTIGDFQKITQGADPELWGKVIGNDAYTRLNVELNGNVATPDPSNVDPGLGLISSGVDAYVVTALNGFDRHFSVCDNTQGLKTLGLQQNPGNTIYFHQVNWGVDFLMEGDGAANWNDRPKADGNPNESNIGSLVANYFWPGATAEITITNQGVALGETSTGGSRPMIVEGIEINNAVSVSVMVEDGNAVIHRLAGTLGDSDPIETVSLASEYDVTLWLDSNASEWETLDASEVEGTAALFITGTIDLSNTELNGVNEVIMQDGSEITLTFAQIQALDRFDVEKEGDEAILNIGNLGEEAFSMEDIDAPEGISLGTVTIVAEDEVTLHPDTNLTGATKVIVQEGTTLNLTAAQYNQISGDNGVKIEVLGEKEKAGKVNITNLTQEDIIYTDAEGEQQVFDLSGIVAENDEVADHLVQGTVSLGAAELVLGSIPHGLHAELAGFALDTGSAFVTLTTAAQGHERVIEGDGSALLLGFWAIDTWVDFDKNPAIEEFRLGIDAENWSSGIVSVKVLTTLLEDGAYGNNIEQILANLSSDIVVEIVSPDEVEIIVPTTQREVVIEAGTTVESGIVIDDLFTAVDGTAYRDITEVTLTLEGNTEVEGTLNLSAQKGLAADGLEELTVVSRGDGGNVLADIRATGNNLLNMQVTASSELEVGTIYFSAVEEDEDEDVIASLIISGSAQKTIKSLNTGHPNVDALAISNTGGALFVTGGSPALNVFNTGWVSLSGTGDMKFGSPVLDDSGEETGAYYAGVRGADLTRIDATGLSGKLDLGILAAINSKDFTFASGTGETHLTLGHGVTLNADPDLEGEDEEPGWTFNMGNAAKGSSITIMQDTNFWGGALTINLDGDVNIDGEVNLRWLDKVDLRDAMFFVDGADEDDEDDVADVLHVSAESFGYDDIAGLLDNAEDYFKGKGTVIAYDDATPGGQIIWMDGMAIRAPEFVEGEILFFENGDFAANRMHVWFTLELDTKDGSDILDPTWFTFEVADGNTWVEVPLTSARISTIYPKRLLLDFNEINLELNQADQTYLLNGIVFETYESLLKGFRLSFDQDEGSDNKLIGFLSKLLVNEFDNEKIAIPPGIPELVPEPAFFAVVDVDVDDQILQGEEATVNVTIANTGNLGGTQTVTLTVDGTGITRTHDVTLDGGEVKVVAFTFATDELDVGDYDVFVETLNDDGQAAFSIFDLLDAYTIFVDGIDPVLEGETVTVTGTIENIGEVEGAHDLVLSINGIVETQAGIIVPVGDTVAFIFENIDLDGLAAGEYTVDVSYGPAFESVDLVVEEPPPVIGNDILDGFDVDNPFDAGADDFLFEIDASDDLQTAIINFSIGDVLSFFNTPTGTHGDFTVTENVFGDGNVKIEVSGVEIWLLDLENDFFNNAETFAAIYGPESLLFEGNPFPQPPETYLVTFTVVDDEANPLEGATVAVNGLAADTDGAGQAVFELEDGDYAYTIDLAGFDQETDNFTVAGADVMIDVVMMPTPVESYSVTVDALDPVEEGDTVTVTGEVDNDGDVPVTFDLVLTINGITETIVDFAVAAGATEPFSFDDIDLTGLAADDYDVEVVYGAESDSTVLTINPADEPAVVAIGIGQGNVVIDAGDEATIFTFNVAAAQGLVAGTQPVINNFNTDIHQLELTMPAGVDIPVGADNLSFLDDLGLAGYGIDDNPFAPEGQVKGSFGFDANDAVITLELNLIGVGEDAQDVQVSFAA